MSEGKDMSSAPRNGTVFFGMSSDDRWPQPMKWEAYSPDDAAELGEDGYWTYCEELIADVAGGANPVKWWPMIDLAGGYSDADALRDLQDSILQSTTISDFMAVKKTVEAIRASEDQND